jgi:hypothetical protein
MRKFSQVLFFLVAFIAGSSLAIAAFPDVTYLLKTTYNAGTGGPHIFERGVPTKVVQINLNGASAVSASVAIQGSLDGDYWMPITTFTMASQPSASAAQSAVITVPYRGLRAVLSSINSVSGATVASGTAGYVDVMVSY